MSKTFRIIIASIFILGALSLLTNGAIVSALFLLLGGVLLLPTVSTWIKSHFSLWRKVWVQLVTIAVMVVFAAAFDPTNGIDDVTSEVRTTSTPESERHDSAVTENTIHISAKDLYREYDRNEIAADNMYGDRVIVVTGKIESITETFGVVSVSLKGDDFSLVSIDCEFEDRKDVANLSKGQEASIKGKCKGLMAGLVIVLEDCLIQ